MKVIAILLSLAALVLSVYNLYTARRQQSQLHNYSTQLAEQIDVLGKQLAVARVETKSLFEQFNTVDRTSVALAEQEERIAERAGQPVSDPDIKKDIDAAARIRPEDVANDAATREAVRRMEEEADRKSQQARQAAKNCVEKLLDLQSQLMAAERDGVQDTINTLTQAIADTQTECAVAAKKAKDTDALKRVLAALLRAAAFAAVAKGNYALAYGLWTAANALEAGAGDGGDSDERGDSKCCNYAPPPPAPPVITEDGEVIPAPENTLPIAGTGGTLRLFLSDNRLMISPPSPPKEIGAILNRTTLAEIVKAVKSQRCSAKLDLGDKKVTLSCFGEDAVGAELHGKIISF